MSPLRFLCILLALCTMGCSSSGKVLSRYFERVASIEGQMAQLQSEFVKSESLHFKERKEIYHSIAARARAAREELLKIQTPPPAEKYRDLLAAAFGDFADFAVVASDSLASWEKSDEEKADMAKRRQEHQQSFAKNMELLMAEQQRLAGQYGLKFD